MKDTSAQGTESDGAGTTATLCAYYHALKLSDIPPAIIERAKHIMLDGIGCALVGARVPWSTQLLQAFEAFEPAGQCTVFGTEKRYGPLAAALLNSAFIQATELDDYHSRYPLHGASVVLPAVFAALECDLDKPAKESTPITGSDFLLAVIVGLETGPRVGAGLYGTDLLTRGWHSGPIFGSPASAMATSKLLGLSPDDTESAVGIACTQAGGLMAAQYEGMIKRVQHGFAARNGLLGTLVARNGYVGIKKVLERPYGGFLSMFSAGNNRIPQWKTHEVVAGLGEVWHIEAIRIKLYACVGGCHGQIEVLEKMQHDHPERFTREELRNITSISVWLSSAIYAHDGWAPEQRPMETTGAQMNAAYIGAVQLVDRQVLLAQFSDHTLNRDDVWQLVYKTKCFPSEEFDRQDCVCGARIKVQFADGLVIEGAVDHPRGYDPPLDNSEIRQKFRRLAISVIDKERAIAIEKVVLGVEKLDNLTELLHLFTGYIGNALT